MSITDIYGLEANEYVLDGATILQAMIGEYYGYMLFNDKAFDNHSLAVFMMSRLDDVMIGMMQKQQKPILSSKNMHDFMKIGMSDNNQSPTGVTSEIEAIRGVIHKLELELERKDDILSALLVLEEEFDKPGPQSILIKGMIVYLKSLKIKEIKTHLAKLDASMY